MAPSMVNFPFWEANKLDIPFFWGQKCEIHQATTFQEVTLPPTSTEPEVRGSWKIIRDVGWEATRCDLSPRGPWKSQSARGFLAAFSGHAKVLEQLGARSPAAFGGVWGFDQGRPKTQRLPFAELHFAELNMFSCFSPSVTKETQLPKIKKNMESTGRCYKGIAWPTVWTDLDSALPHGLADLGLPFWGPRSGFFKAAQGRLMASNPPFGTGRRNQKHIASRGSSFGAVPPPRSESGLAGR